MEATRNITVRNEARGWSTMIGALVDRVLPASEPTVPRATVVQIVACLIDGLMLEAVSNGQLSIADLAKRLKIVVERFCVRL